MIDRKAKIQSTLIAVLLVVAAIITGVLALIVFNPAGGSSPLGTEYAYDIEQYAKIDPTMIRYAQEGDVIEVDFDQSRAISLSDDGDIYIVGDEKVAIYSPLITVPMEVELGVEPTCITVESDGTMVIGAANMIFLIDSMGAERARWTLPVSDAVLTSIVADDEHIFVADALNKFIWHLDRQGNVMNKIGQKNLDENIPGFVIPSPYFDIAMAPDGLLRVVNPGRHWIEAYTVDGHREWYWGTASVGIKGFSGCCNPVNFAMLPDGGFVTVEKGLIRVKTYDMDGQFQDVVAGPDELGWLEPVRVCSTPEECQSKGFDVAVDSNGRIYVLDTVRNVVRIFKKKLSEA